MNRLRRSVTLLAVLAVFCLSTPAVLAAWSASSAGNGAASATTMPVGTTPTGSATGTSVAVQWTAVTLSSGVGVAGYVIHRFDAINGTGAAVGPGCSGVITTTTCTELSVPAGTWVYTDTPVQLTWNGGQSPASGAIIVL